MLVDISRAHQHCDLTKEVFIRLPKEDPRSKEDDTCGLLLSTHGPMHLLASRVEDGVCAPQG
eukprot:146747-Amphidinium_carterae.1